MGGSFIPVDQQAKYPQVRSMARNADLVGNVAQKDCPQLAKRLLSLFRPSQLEGRTLKLTKAVCNSFVGKHVGEQKILMWLALEREVSFNWLWSITNHPRAS
jgi:hypothetical protein